MLKEKKRLPKQARPLVTECIVDGESTDAHFKKSFADSLRGVANPEITNGGVHAIVCPNWCSGDKFNPAQGFVVRMSLRSEPSYLIMHSTKQGRGITAARLSKYADERSCTEVISRFPREMITDGEFIGAYESHERVGYGVRRSRWLVTRIGDTETSERLVNSVSEVSDETWREYLDGGGEKLFSDAAAALSKKRHDVLTQAAADLGTTIDVDSVVDVVEYSLCRDRDTVVCCSGVASTETYSSILLAETPGLGVHILHGPSSGSPAPGRAEGCTFFPTFTGRKPKRSKEGEVQEIGGSFYHRGKKIELTPIQESIYRTRDKAFRSCEVTRLGRSSAWSEKYLVPIAVAMG